MNVYILVSDNRKELTIDGSLELFGQLLSTIQHGVADAERKPRGEILRTSQDDSRTRADGPVDGDA